jgi:uracil-DNA glycosylase
MCDGWPCTDVRTDRHAISGLVLDPDAVSIVLVSEVPAPLAANDYEAGEDALFARTTVQAFRDAGAHVRSLDDVRRLGVYLTTAVKCGKTAYAVSPATIATCSHLLERELALFPRPKALLLMGDVAKAAVNAIAARAGERRVIPAGPTYRIRQSAHSWRGMRVFPSYLQAGPSYFIETSKRRMIAEDIAAALAVAAST